MIEHSIERTQRHEGMKTADLATLNQVGREERVLTNEARPQFHAVEGPVRILVMEIEKADEQEEGTSMPDSVYPETSALSPGIAAKAIT